MANKYHSDVQNDLSTVDFGSVAEADINAQVDLALNTAIPASNVANSVNDVLLDQLSPRLPASGTICKSPTYEMFTYYPNIMDTTDLEAATKTITATAEASGTVNADYSKSLTLPIPTDARLVMASIASRVSVTIDSDDGTHDLRCRVYVDAQDASHMLFDLTYATTGNQLAVVGLTSGTIFNLLKDGAAHTLYFFFWTPGNHAPVISVVQAWYGSGSVKASAWGTRVLTFTSTPACELQARIYHVPQGTGGQGLHFVITNTVGNQYAGLFGTTETGLVASSYPTDSGYAGMTWQLLPAASPVYFCLYGSGVATSAYFFIGITLFIKRWD